MAEPELSTGSKTRLESLHRRFLSGGNLLRRKVSDSQRFVIYCVIAGVLCGLVGVTFQYSIDLVFQYTIVEHPGLGSPLGWTWLVGMPAMGGLVVGLVLRYVSPQSVGSGIPQTKKAYFLDFGVISFRDGLWRMLIGIVSIGTGNSFGRFGPTVFICAAISSTIGQLFGMAKARVQAMVPVGMGAGIAAAFNTPIAALFFVFEQLLSDFSSKALGGIVVAVVIAAIVERSLLGEEAILAINFEPMATEPWMLICLPLGVAAALVGHLFVFLLLWWRQAFRKQNLLPVWARPAVGGLGVGLIGISVLWFCGENGVYGTGMAELNAAVAGKLGLQALVLLLAGKLLATSFCFGAGGSGGIFAPVLVMGSMLGGVLGVLLLEVFPRVPPEVVQACALLGTGALFAAVIRCKFTSMLIIIELTQNYTLVLPLMAGNLIAYALSYRLRPVPVYDALLLQDGISLKRMPTYIGERDWRNLPVSTIMTYDTVTLPGAEHPPEALARVAQRPHHGYPVMADDSDRDEVIGMLCHHELEEAIHDGRTETLREMVKGQELIVIHPDTSIREVANVLVTQDVLQVPVVSKKEKNRLVGIVTLHDIARQQNAIQESIGR